MTTHYLVVLTCPRCGADLKHITAGSRWSWQQAAAVECTECTWRGVLNVVVSEVSTWDNETRRVEREQRRIAGAVAHQRGPKRQKVKA